jgi:hypothetical protein
VILFLALYPQLALHRSEASVKASVARVQQARFVASLPRGCNPAALAPGEEVLACATDYKVRRK